LIFKKSSIYIIIFILSIQAECWALNNLSLDSINEKKQILSIQLFSGFGQAPYGLWVNGLGYYTIRNNCKMGIRYIKQRGDLVIDLDYNFSGSELAQDVEQDIPINTSNSNNAFCLALGINL